MIFFLTLTVWGPFHRKDLRWKKTWGTGLLSVKTEALFAELNKKVEAATSSYSATSDFYNIFILFLWLGIIRRSNESVYFMNFPLQIFLTILIMVTEQQHWRKIICGYFRFIWLWLRTAIMKRCAERCALQLYRTSLRYHYTKEVFTWTLVKTISFMGEKHFII